jgi:hypothetical protein
MTARRTSSTKPALFVLLAKKPSIAALCLLTMFALPLLSATDARAWGSEGHRVIAEIAEQYLEPTTARRVRELLTVENATTLAEISNWADQIRGQRRSTAPWHFVDIPISSSAYDKDRDCPHGDCVVAKIDQFVLALRDPDLDPYRRLEALKFVVHFVGDLHQPLHASDNGDRGGNEIRVEFMGRRTNLHAVWDSGILSPAVRGDERSYALRLVHSMSAAQIKAWSNGDPQSWTNDSHDVAVRFIYGTLPHGSGVLPESYAYEALPLVDRQLQKAGIRLAVTLNSALSR